MIPKHYKSEIQGDNCSIWLEDMSIEYPITNGQNYNPLQLKTGCEWLAHFHRVGWGGPQNNQEGSYWHLDTRLEELENIKDPTWFELKKAARPIADKLKFCKLG
mgnify:CR=1 FL=1